MKRIRLLMRSLLVLTLLPSFNLAYSQITISGKVSSATDQSSLPGVNIVIKGSATGTITDLEGNYSIQVPDAEAVLVYSYIGFLAEEVAVGNQTTIDMSLVEDLTSVDEVIVIGYGTRKKSDMTGAVGSVNENYLENSTHADPVSALQGSVAGVTVTTPGTPGGDAEIRVRGMGTINNNDPLIVVDGIFGANMPSQSEIKEIQVLKDAASTAIYGSRGANGVILVTTIQGNKHKPMQVNVNVRTGINYSNDKYDIITNPNTYLEALQLEADNAGTTLSHDHYTNDGNGNYRLNDYVYPVGANEGDPGTDMSLYDKWDHPITRSNRGGTDWLDEIYQKGVIQDYNVSVSGGSEKTRYAFALNYLDKEGIVKYSGFNRVGVRSNIESDVRKWLTVGQTLSYSKRERYGPTSNNVDEGLFKDIYDVSPLVPVFTENGDLAGERNITSMGIRPTPYANVYFGKDERDNSQHVLGNVYAQFNIIDGLSFKTLYGYTSNSEQNFDPQLPRYDRTTGVRTASLTEERDNNFRWNWTNTLNYTKTLKQHNFDILLGTEAVDYSYDEIEADRDGFFSDDLDYLVLDAGESGITNGGTRGSEGLYSLFGRLHYGFASKYLADFSLRQDKSSKFGKTNPAGIFPSVSLGWEISQESFMSATKNWMSYLKFRGSWGQSGNDQIGAYNSYSTYIYELGGSDYDINGTNNSSERGFHSSQFGDDNVKWETTSTVNIGIDATFFSSLSLTMDFWQKNTSDMLYAQARPGVIGMASAPSINIGDMENKGLDITLDYKGSALNKELRYFITATYSMYRNKIVKLSGAEEYIQGSASRGEIFTRAESGTSFPEFYGYIVDGIFQTEEEAEAWPEYGSYNAPGKYRFVDVDSDGEITADDRTYMGSPHPDFTASLNLGLEYKGVDFSASFYVSYGNDIINFGKYYYDYGGFEIAQSEARLKESWGSPYLNGNNAAATLPMAISGGEIAELAAHSEYVEDGSYLRMQNIQLGYSLPLKWTESLKIQRARIYLMGTNLWTLTKYTGLNPEVPLKSSTRPDGIFGTREIDRGIDIGSWPVPKEFIIGLNLTF